MPAYKDFYFWMFLFMFAANFVGNYYQRKHREFMEGLFKDYDRLLDESMAMVRDGMVREKALQAAIMELGGDEEL